MIENTTVTGAGKPVPSIERYCTYDGCHEDVLPRTGIQLANELFCSAECMALHLIATGKAIEED